VAGAQAYLVIEHLELHQEGDFAALGAMLARLHGAAGTRYGWSRDNYIGATEQENAWAEEWPAFFRERRLRPQIALAQRNGFSLECDFVLDNLDKLLGHGPRPSLLHGDLWSGNAGFHRGEPVLFDPAVYYGDRECDLAMTELFGGFPADFYASYAKELPLDAGYGKRKHLYNLYHLLNHLNIFGGGYLGQVSSTLGLLRSFLQ